MKSWRLILLSCVCLVAAFELRAEDKPALVFQNLGLKNNYRVIFEQWDDENHFASGALEVSENVEDKVHTRIPFSADVKVDTKDKKTEVLSVRCTAMEFFFPPPNKKDPYPPLTWRLTGRKTKQASLKASLWTFAKSAWVLDTLEFEKAEK
jgi:hypothetical protein